MRANYGRRFILAYLALRVHPGEALGELVTAVSIVIDTLLEELCFVE